MPLSEGSQEVQDLYNRLFDTHCDLRKELVQLAAEIDARDTVLPGVQITDYVRDWITDTEGEGGPLHSIKHSGTIHCLMGLTNMYPREKIPNALIFDELHDHVFESRESDEIRHHVDEIYLCLNKLFETADTLCEEGTPFSDAVRNLAAEVLGLSGREVFQSYVYAALQSSLRADPMHHANVTGIQTMGLGGGV
jgi:hypothetical protein